MIKAKKIRLFLIILAALLATVILVFYAWTLFYYRASENAISNLESNDYVKVVSGKNISFMPETLKAPNGFIFYPGGKVDEKSYAYIGQGIAENGFYAFIIQMPLRLAVFNPDAANAVIKKNPEIKNWVIGGHSLGGSMAASFAFNNQDVIKGLVLLASYPAGSDDLSKSGMSVISITGTNDGVLNTDNLEASEKLLPGNMKTVSIPGGNHSQFGDYGFQSGDNNAEISIGEQHKIVVDNILLLLNGLS
jgi:predicted esterase